MRVSHPRPNFHPAVRRRGLLGVLLLACSAAVLAQQPTAVTINHSRVYTIGPATEFRLDDTPISEATARQLGLGYSVRVEASAVGAGVLQGQALRVDFDNLLRGPITAIDPLTALNQPLVITADSVLEGVPDGDVGALEIGQLIEVSGFLDIDAGAIVVSRLSTLGNPTTDWKLVGEVSQATGNGFHIGAQPIDSSGVTATGCPLGVVNGVVVELEALPDPGYTAASTLGQLTELHCEDPAIGTPPPGTTLASLEGIISELPDPLPTPPQFGLLGITVQTDAQTTYRAGSIDDLALGVRVEVDGAFDPGTRVLAAREVRFTQPQTRFTAPLAPADLVPGDQVTILGNTVRFNAQTRDEDGLAAGGLGEALQVEVRALLDRDGVLHASRIRERGEPDLQDTRLQGPVAAIAEPMLEILGNAVDTSGARFVDPDGNTLSAGEFFALLQVGIVVSAEDATYDPQLGLLQAGEVQIEDDLPPPAALRGGPTGLAVSRGTLSGFGARDEVFRSGFE